PFFGAIEGQAATEQDEENDPTAPNVHWFPIGFSFHHFRSHEMRRAHTACDRFTRAIENNLQQLRNASLARMTKITAENCTMDDISLQVPLSVVYTLFFILGLAGNLLALWVHSKKNSVRIFLINLALADLFLVICLPFRVMYHFNNNRWVLPSLLCKIVGNIFYMNMYMSIVLLGLISIDRYLKFQRASCRPRLVQCQWSVILCGAIWSVSLASCIPLMLQSSERTESQQCFQYKQLLNSKWKAYFNLAVVGMFWVVYGALVWSYGKIGMKLLTAARVKRDFPNSTKFNKTAQKSFFVLFSFTICYVPYHVVRIFYILSQMASDISCNWINVLDKTNEAVLLLSALNSCLDPVMYFLLCSSVRKTTMRIIANCFCQETRDGQMSSSATPEAQILTATAAK
ncbi:hypothetical protein DNTS_035574, partial [Danionella cerebrum]